MIRRPPRSTLSSSSAASDVYKRQVKDVEQEIGRRLAAPAGTPYQFPRGKLGDNRPPNEAAIPSYIKAVYGEHEAGGTQVRYLAGVPFQKLGLPTVAPEAPAALAEGVQHTIY